MLRAWPYILIAIAIIALVWLAWRIYDRRASIHQNDPHRHLSRRDRRRIAREEADLALQDKQQDVRERIQIYIDPSHPKSDVWKDLEK